MSQLHIGIDHRQLHTADAISIEEYQKRRVQRRRRVAKRKLAQVPLFAVEEMQGEFPGYTYEEFIADVTRKTRKGKSFRRPKPRKFDWHQILKQAPSLFYACKKRTPTSATLFFRLKDGLTFTCIVRSSWFDGQRQCRLRTSDLIALWNGRLIDFCRHPAMSLLEHNNELSADVLSD